MPWEEIPTDIHKTIRLMRLQRDLTLQEFSEKSGLSVSFLSQVERGNSSLTITSLQRIAEGFGVPITTFFESAENNTYFTPKDSYRPFKIEGSRVSYTRLAGNFSGRNLEPMIVELLPYQAFEATYSHPGEEFYFVLQGQIRMQVGDEDYILKEGDAIHFPSTIAHNWENVSEIHARILCVLYPVIF